MARGKKSTHVDGQGSLFDLLDMEPDAPQLTPGEDELDAEANEPDSGLRTAVRPEPVRGDSGPGDVLPADAERAAGSGGRRPGVDAGRDVEAERRGQGEPAEDAGRVPGQDERRERTGVAGSGARPVPAGGGRDRGAAGPGDSPAGAGGREPAGLTPDPQEPAAEPFRLAAGDQYPPSGA